MGEDVFVTVVDWVVKYEPLIKKIGCDDKEMWHAYLLVRDSGNFICISKRCNFVSHPFLKQPLFEIKVHIGAGENKMWHCNRFCLMQKSSQTYAKRKTSSGASWFLMASVLSFQCSPCSVVMVLWSNKDQQCELAPGYQPLWFHWNLQPNCGQSIQCNTRWGKSICSQLLCDQHQRSIHPLPFSNSVISRENWIIVIKSFGQKWLRCSKTEKSLKTHSCDCSHRQGDF